MEGMDVRRELIAANRRTCARGSVVKSASNCGGCAKMRWAGDVSERGFVRLCVLVQQRRMSHSARGGASVLSAPGSV